MKKKLIIIIPVVIALIIIGLGIFFYIKNNSESKLTRDADLGSVKITNVSIVYENNLSTLRAVVEVQEDIHINYILITATDKNGKTLETVGYIGRDVTKGERVNIVSSTDVNITDYKTIKYEIK